MVVAGAIASRDFMPVHHDRDYAQAQGAPDLFMNILTTTGYVDALRHGLGRSDVRGAAPRDPPRRPAVPGLALHFTGAVTDQREEGGAVELEVTLRAANDLGDHATGTVELTLPADEALRG